MSEICSTFAVTGLGNSLPWLVAQSPRLALDLEPTLKQPSSCFIELESERLQARSVGFISYLPTSPPSSPPAGWEATATASGDTCAVEIKSTRDSSRRAVLLLLGGSVAASNYL